MDCGSGGGGGESSAAISSKESKQACSQMTGIHHLSAIIRCGNRYRPQGLHRERTGELGRGAQARHNPAFLSARDGANALPQDIQSPDVRCGCTWAFYLGECGW